ncbi:MAG: ATP synthase F0 subunit C [Bdellovibrionales bacterium]|nr:ATP synthase F0 subunit C [Bdellovibrionales bacterium]MBL7686494.1 ATP synthase F0 subunit C [Pseudobdellovibrionaceae bacterium]
MKKNLFFALTALLASSSAFAEEATTAAVAAGTSATAAGVSGTVGWVALSVGIMMGLAVLGGTLGQSKAANAALDGIARNPAASGKLTLPLVLSLALMESLVLFAFLIGLSLQGSISEALKVIK